MALSTNSVSAWEPTSILECCATHKVSLQRGRDLEGSCYSPILFPAGEGPLKAALPTSSLSGPEGILHCLAKHQFCFPMEPIVQY